MAKAVILTVLMFFLCLSGYAQIFPKENDKLHYRIIGFSFPAELKSKDYTLQIAFGNCNNEDSFQKKILLSEISLKNKVIAEVPDFGSEYTWRIITKNSAARVIKRPFHHFSTLFNTNMDTNTSRLRILKPAEQYKDAYFFVDCTRALYDMNGKPVWFLPAIEGNNDYIPRDIKLTSRGTITFVVEEIGLYEINYNGAIIWKGPKKALVSGDSTEHFHHSLTRLANGNYMTLGYESIMWDPALSIQENWLNYDKKTAVEHSALSHPVQFGTILEYNSKGNLVWSWKSSSYFRESDIFSKKNGNAGAWEDMHENAFFYDEKKQVVYVSYKGISRVLKVKYPEGDVLQVYGEIFHENVREGGNGLFCGQHSLFVSSDGYLGMYNNNNCNNKPFPKLQLMQETGGKDSLKTVWSYEYKIDQLNKDFMAEAARNGTPRSAGGNIMELPGKKFFTSFSSPYGYLFIVDREQHLLWSAVLEKWNAESKMWMQSITYRASIISNRKEFDKLLFMDSIKWPFL